MWQVPLSFFFPFNQLLSSSLSFPPLFELYSFRFSCPSSRCLVGHALLACSSKKEQTVGWVLCDVYTLWSLHVWLSHQTCPSGPTCHASTLQLVTHRSWQPRWREFQKRLFSFFPFVSHYSYHLQLNCFNLNIHSHVRHQSNLPFVSRKRSMHTSDTTVRSSAEGLPLATRGKHHKLLKPQGVMCTTRWDWHSVGAVLPERLTGTVCRLDNWQQKQKTKNSCGLSVQGPEYRSHLKHLFNVFPQCF